MLFGFLTLPGPQFLLFYFIVGVVIVAAWTLYPKWYFKKKQKGSFSSINNPYLLIYLQGRAVAALKLAIFSLYVKEQISWQFNKSRTSMRFEVKDDAASGTLTPLEKLVKNRIPETGTRLLDFVSSSKLLLDIDSHIETTYPKFATSSFFISSKDTKHLKSVRLLAFVVFIGIGVSKLVYALSNGYTNVFFLLALLGIGIGFLSRSIKYFQGDHLDEYETQRIKVPKVEKRVDQMTDDELVQMVAKEGVGFLKKTKYSKFYKLITVQSVTQTDVADVDGCFGSCSTNIFSMAYVAAASSSYSSGSSYGSSSGGYSSCSSCGGGCSSCGGGCGGCG